MTAAAAPSVSDSSASDPTVTAPPRRPVLLAPLALAGAAVSLALGVYAHVHRPTGGAIVDLGFPSVKYMKAVLTSVSTGFVLLQVVSAMAMFGRLPIASADATWVAIAHRWSGTVAFVVSLPVAYHCLWAFGLDLDHTRPLVHGLLGCAFYGAFTTKMLALRTERLPRWALPVLGSLVAVLLTALWATSALWFFGTLH